MISVFNGRSRSLDGKSDGEDVHVQVSVALRKHLRLFKGAKFGVFMAIALHSDKFGWSRPSTKLLRRETGYNADTIFNALADLCKLEIEGHRVLLRKGARRSSGEFSTNNYLIFPKKEEIEKYETRYLFPSGPLGEEEDATAKSSSTVSEKPDTVNSRQGESPTRKKPDKEKTRVGEIPSRENADTEVDPITQLEPSSSELLDFVDHEQEPHTPNESASHTGKTRDGVRVGSIFDKDTLEKYAWAKMNYYDAINHHLSQGNKHYQPMRTIDNPGGWAEYAVRTGNHDVEVQRWIDDFKVFSFERWLREES